MFEFVMVLCFAYGGFCFLLPGRGENGTSGSKGKRNGGAGKGTRPTAVSAPMADIAKNAAPKARKDPRCHGRVERTSRQQTRCQDGYESIIA